MLQSGLDVAREDGERMETISLYASFINNIDDANIYSWSWQNAVDAEYLSQVPGRIKYTDGWTPVRGYTLVDLRWTKEGEIPAAYSEACSVAFERGAYRVYKCL